MKKKGLIILGVILVIIALFSFINMNANKEQYKTRALKKRTIVQSVFASGTVNPVITVSIGSQVSGTIKELYVDYNSEVKKGQLLAQIDPALFEARVNESRASLNNAQANYDRVKSVMENDLKTYNRYKALYERKFVAKSELDLAESTYKADVASLNAAKAQIEQAKATLDNNLTNLRYTRIISPVDGIVVSRSVDVGQTVAASFQTPTLFSVAQDLTKMQIDTSVVEADIGRVKVGQDVEYTIDGYPDETFTGKVSQVRISPTTVQNVVTYNVVIIIDNKDLKLIPGMTANVSIITNKKENVLCVDNRALKFSPQTSKDGTKKKYQEYGVWILEKNKPKRVTVQIGASDENYTEITSDELKEGDRVIISSTSKGKAAVKRRMRPF